ncbi:ATP-binding protein [Bifidobacterium cuniculi]|uniref:ATPase (AAA superfamily)-like protein n=1 Tax=Bifidobacterium cuniculi TaxID=1688 RepID=A0A087AYB9_9BIFI|nr:ATP-binding protein [Bifidobacterium cuniculi]KFI63769.1 ATPase (AAA superfamily)-like protein [Bifidobacterium cuniculi]
MALRVERAMMETLLDLATMFPAVTLTGPRQSGKSTLVKHAFPGYAYVSLEDPDVRDMAFNDPRRFLERYDSRAIIDEVQYAPELFSYMQGVLDSRDEMGRYILTGSQNFLLLDTISQSLAGRVGILHLLPLSYRELMHSAMCPDLDVFMYTGGYPRLYSTPARPDVFYPAYLSTYVDRDIRRELGVRKVAQFNKFLTVCATRIGQVLNVTGMANDCDVDFHTADNWLLLLEASFIVMRLQPYYKNYGKRLIRAPKLYFYDTGLAANLLGVEDADQLATGVNRRNLFENAVITEIIKQTQAQGRTPKLYYWRDSNRKEIDLVIEKGGQPWQIIEIKSSSTFRYSAFATITDMGDTMGVPTDRRYVVYGGTESIESDQGHVIGLNDIHRIVDQG